MDGRPTDAGGHSLTEIGAGAFRPQAAAACRLCGVSVAPGARFCVNCGAIQQRAASSVPSLRVPPGTPFATGLPPLPARTGTADEAGGPRAGTGVSDESAVAQDPPLTGVPVTGTADAPDRPAAATVPVEAAQVTPGPPEDDSERPIYADAEVAAVASDASARPPAGPGTPAKSGRVRPQVQFGHAAAEPPAKPRAQPVARGERLVAWLAFGVLIVTAAFFIHRIVSGSLQDAPPPPAPGASTPRATNPPPPAAETSTTQGEAPPSAAASAARAVDSSRTPAPRAETIVPPPEEASAAAVSRALKPAAPRATPVVTPATPAPPPPAPVERIEAAHNPPPPATSPAEPDSSPRAPAAPATRWAQMAVDLRACASGGFLERVACEHRVRARYCDGWWGRAEECPSGRQADYGN